MIEYVEIRLSSNREMIGIIDTAKSVIWHTAYYGVGDFEIYAPVTPQTVPLLAIGNYVTRPDARDVGIIENISITYNAQDGRMIAASGRFAKSLLDRRVIYKISGTSVSPAILRGNVEDAARKLVTDNAISCTFDTGRNIGELVLGTRAGIAKTIKDESGAAAEKQVTYKGLLEYTDALLQEYELGAYCGLDSAGKLAYTVYSGLDRSVGNADGREPVIFSQEFDNLVSSAYAFDVSTFKNAALIGGEGEGTARICAIMKDSAVTGAARREIFVDASSTSKTYQDESGTEQTMTDAEYILQLKTLGTQTVAGLSVIETFNGGLDLLNGSFRFGRDFGIGDLVTVEDNGIGLYVNARILEATEVQDQNGYNVTVIYGI